MKFQSRLLLDLVILLLLLVHNAAVVSQVLSWVITAFALQ